MAIFPERLVLKESSDAELSILNSIKVGGTDAIVPGELVIGREQNYVKLYALDANNKVVAVGPGSISLDDLTTVRTGHNWYTSFETDEPTYTSGANLTISTEQAYTGTSSLKSTGTSLNASFSSVFQSPSNRYDCWSFWVYPTQLISSSYILPLGGSQGTNQDSGYALYIDGTNIRYRGNAATFTLGTGIPVMSVNTWHHVFVQIDWNSPVDRTSNPAISVWIDGILRVGNVRPNIAYNGTSGTWSGQSALSFRDIASSSWVKYIDTLQAGQTNSAPIVGMVVSNITPATIDTAIRNLGPFKGSYLAYNGAEWLAAEVDTNLASLEDVSITLLGTNDYLRYNGTHWVNTPAQPFDIAYDGGNFDTGTVDTTTTIFDQFDISINAFSDVDTITTPPNVSESLIWDGSNWVPTAINIRKTISYTTGSIANNASENFLLTGTGKSGQFISVALDKAGWLVLYSSTAARDADSSRASTVDPTPGSGVLLEVITTGAETIDISPALAYFNSESTPLAQIPARLTNLVGSPQSITLQVTLIPSEL